MMRKKIFLSHAHHHHYLPHLEIKNESQIKMTSAYQNKKLFNSIEMSTIITIQNLAYQITAPKRARDLLTTQPRVQRGTAFATSKKLGINFSRFFTSSSSSSSSCCRARKQREKATIFRERKRARRMSLTGVKMSEDVWLTCLTHALSTETEEIMGLLLGDIEVHSLPFPSSNSLASTYVMHVLGFLTVRVLKLLDRFDAWSKCRAGMVWVFGFVF